MEIDFKTLIIFVFLTLVGFLLIDKAFLHSTILNFISNLFR